jgi:hypothetical protein
LKNPVGRASEISRHTRFVAVLIQITPTQPMALCVYVGIVRDCIFWTRFPCGHRYASRALGIAW